MRFSPLMVDKADGAVPRPRSLGEFLGCAADPASADASPSLSDVHVVDVRSGGGGGSMQYPFVLSFADLTYSVRTAKAKADRAATADAAEQRSAAGGGGSAAGGRTKTVLDSITGEAREGEILAVLGASGSGKSTLIDALANRIQKESLRGSVTLNGEVLDGKLLKSISAYVMQDDLLFPMLTVEETLMFSADFRLPRTLSASKKKARVQALIDQLGLRAAARTIIGDEGHRGVSGGERRRVSIGTDIIHDPIILFLDEPTSGLDSTSAFMVVNVLRRIARSGSVVVMTVHQPSSRILGLLDRLLFLSRGQTVYFGPPDALPLYLSEFGRPVPDNENRTEFTLDLIRELESSPTGPKPLVEFNRSWQAMRTTSSSRDDEPEAARSSLKDAICASVARGKLVSSGTTFVNPFWIEMLVLCRRSFTNTRRMPELYAIRLGAVLVTGFILATMFWKLDDTPKGVMERVGMFAFAMSTVYFTCADALPVFLQERYIFMRETAYNAYRRSSYVLSNAIVAVPPLVVLAASFAVTTFFATGLSGGASGFFFFFLTILASFWAGTSFVTFLSGVIPHVMVGYTVVVAILAYFLLFSGFFISRQRMPDYWLWFHYLSLVKYPYQGVMQNEFGDAGRCFARGVEIFDNTMMAAMSDAAKEKALAAIGSAFGVEVGDDTCVTTGTNVLQQEGVTDLSKWGCLWVTVAWGFFFRVLFYFALLLGSKNKRR
ncbi:ABC transporter G family member 16 [Iris pallida]|uniref:ABC transporter G family member 5 n=1 Tax=Iris pallida TaxID=29817 RepID=A0AAX6GQT4_IRIPA|nr:ABC transporter G family member 16 [Iris pallida]